MKNRYLYQQVNDDLSRKMVFLGGPRQSGKTTLAKSLLTSANSQGYLNWDDSLDKDKILSRELPNTSLWIFDEIHKFRGWRNYLKGLYDKKKSHQKILVTGSARLDLYRYGGDSLQGRYHFLRLHPLSIAEISKTPTPSDLEELFHIGGFPEPFFGGSKVQANRWSLEYKKRLVREDVSTLESLQDLTKIELLLQSLPAKVGSPLSINSLREDLQIAHKTAANWLNILERLYSIYRILPFGAPKLRAVKKEQKHYHFDWNLVDDEANRFENMMANHIFKWVQYLEDTEGREMELRYFRDIDGREVDFIVLEKQKPKMLIEVKLSDAPISNGLKYFYQRFPNCEAWQVHFKGKKDYTTPEGIRVAPALTLLKKFI